MNHHLTDRLLGKQLVTNWAIEPVHRLNSCGVKLLPGHSTQDMRVHNLNLTYTTATGKAVKTLPPFSLLRDFSFQNTSEHFAIRFRQSYLIWEVCDVTAIELSSKE